MERGAGIMAKTRLKKCQFCGAEVKTEPLYDTRGAITAVYCTNDPECGAMVTFVGNESKKKAITAWNRRAPELINKDFAGLTPEQYEQTIAGLSGLVPIIIPFLMKQNLDNMGVEDAAECAITLQIAADAVKELMQQVYGCGEAAK